MIVGMLGVKVPETDCAFLAGYKGNVRLYKKEMTAEKAHKQRPKSEGLRVERTTGRLY